MPYHMIHVLLAVNIQSEAARMIHECMYIQCIIIIKLKQMKSFKTLDYYYKLF